MGAFGVIGAGQASAGARATTAQNKTKTAATAVTKAEAVVKAAEAPIDKLTLKLPPLADVKKLKGKTVLVVPIDAVALSTTLTALGHALSSAGLNMKLCDGQGSPSTIAGCMAQAPSEGVAAVMTIAVPYQLVPSAYQQDENANIPVLAAFQPANGQASSRTLAFQSYGPEFSKGLSVVDDYVIAKTKGTAHVLYLGVSDSASALSESQGGVAYLKKACPKCSVTEQNFLTPTVPTQLPGAVSSFVVQNPKTNYIVAMNVDVDGTGIVSGLQSANKTSVEFGGTGTGLGGLQLVSQGSGRFDFVFSEEYQAWTFTDAVARLILGRPQISYPVIGRLFDSTNIKSVDLTAAEATTFNWFGKSDSFENEFLTDWGLKK